MTKKEKIKNDIYYDDVCKAIASIDTQILEVVDCQKLDDDYIDRILANFIITHLMSRMLSGYM